MKTAKTAITAILFAIAGVAAAAPAPAPGSNADMPSVTVNAGSIGANSGEGYQGYTGFVTTKTRAQVQAELLAARKNGAIYDGEAYPGPLVSVSSKTRGEVVADLSAFRAAHPDLAEDGAFNISR